jgi:hypothetical protein
MANMPVTAPAAKKTNVPLILGGILVLVLLVGVAVVATYPLTNKNSRSKGNTNVVANTNHATIPTAQAAAFATYNEPTVTMKPAVAATTVQPNLANVYNKNQFNFSASMQAKLIANGFVVQDKAYDKEFFQKYESNRYANIPNFVTTDSILHTYHLFFDTILKQVETDHLTADLKTLSGQMLTASQTQYNELKGSTWQYAAKRNMAFFAVAAKLLDAKATVPSEVKDVVNADLAAIDQHAGKAASAVMNIGVTDPDNAPPEEDFSQYVPRGHYTKSEALERYFRTMMWYGRMTFRFKSDEEVKSAVLMTLGWRPTAVTDRWNAIYEPTSFFVGVSDDIIPLQFTTALKTVYGDSITVGGLAAQTQQFTNLKAALKTMAPPQINSIVIAGTSVDPNSDRTEETMGFRFMGQRFTLDASIFQKLICRDVGNKDGTMPCPSQTSESRMLPKGLDITAAMGSTEAANILRSEGDFQYKNYSEQLAKLKTAIAAVKKSTWTQNLYWSWLYALKPLTETKTAGYPSFMQTTAWQRKDLTTYLGSWTELKHDTILYAKQAYAEMGGGPPDTNWDDSGYVEPEAVLYARLSGLAKMTREGLDIRGLISAVTKTSLTNLETLTTSLMNISVKELQNQALTDADYELIRSYGGQLEHFWSDIYKEDIAKNANFLDNNPAALVADVATDPNGFVLEEAIGYLRPIYAVVSVAGKFKIVSGVVWSHYEFSWPMSDRLTDESWRTMLQNSSPKIPDLPSWTKTYIGSISQ